MAQGNNAFGLSLCLSTSQRERLIANAGDLRQISRAATAVSEELAVLLEDVREPCFQIIISQYYWLD